MGTKKYCFSDVYNVHVMQMVLTDDQINNQKIRLLNREAVYGVNQGSECIAWS